MSNQDVFSHPDLDKGVVDYPDHNDEPVKDNWFVSVAYIALLSIAVASMGDVKPIDSLEDLKERMGKVNEKFQAIQLPPEVTQDEV